MITIEGDKSSLVITILEEKNGGYTGTSGTISKGSLINRLIEEGILEDGEPVYFDEQAEYE